MGADDARLGSALADDGVAFHLVVSYLGDCGARWSALLRLFAYRSCNPASASADTFSVRYVVCLRGRHCLSKRSAIYSMLRNILSCSGHTLPSLHSGRGADNKIINYNLR